MKNRPPLRIAEPAPAPDPGATLLQPPDDIEASRALSTPRALAQHAEAPRLQGYVLVNPLGRGAYARVWRAWQVRTRRWVAVKVFERRTGVDWLLLEREVDLLVRLDKHPNVVTLLDANLAAEPVYYVMDLLEHGSLARWVGAAVPPPLAVAERWMTDIATAVRYVHGKGLIHCDLKPANVLLDEEERVRVADFGQARIFQSAAASLGTLFYMAPEQAAAANTDSQPGPDPRWDVYGLGATMYAILTGAPPHADAHRAADPPRPMREELARYAEDVAHDPAGRLAVPLRGRCDRAFGAILLKCLETDPAARYPSMDALLADLRARRLGRAVSPLASRPGYRAGLFIRRHAVGSVLVAAVLAAAAAGLRLTRPGSAHDLLMLRAQRATERAEYGLAALYWAELNARQPSHLARTNALACLDPSPPPARLFALPAPTRRATLSGHGRLLLIEQADGEAVAFTVPAGVRVATIWKSGMGAGGSGIAISADGRYAATATARETLLWNLAAPRPVARLLPGGPPPRGPGPAFSADGRWLAAAAGDPRTVRLWTAPQTRPGAALHHAAPVLAQSFHPRAPRLTTAAADRVVRFWNPVDGSQDGPVLRTLVLPAQLVWSGGGDRLAVAASRRAIEVWDPIARRRIASVAPPGDRLTTVALSADGAALLTGDAAGDVRIWDTATAEPIGRPMRLPGGVIHAVFAPDARSVLVAALAPPVLLRWRTTWLAGSDPPERLRERARLAVGRRLDAAGAPVPLTPAERADLRRRLSGRASQ